MGMGMVIIFSALFGILLIFFILFILKRKQFVELDLLEAQKMDLLSLPLLEEISRVTDLGLLGQTKEYTTKWKEKWEEITLVKFREIEVMLFEAEAYIDRYRFSLSRALREKTKIKLENIEKEIKEIFKDIESLLEVIEKNKSFLIGLKERFKALSQHIIIYNHSFGASIAHLEKEIEENFSVFLEIEKMMADGNCYAANELLNDMDEKYDIIIEKTRIIPELFETCKVTFPEQLSVLSTMFADMERDGFPLIHIDFPTKFKQFEEQIAKNIALLEKAQTFDVKKDLEEISLGIKELTNLLSEEQAARNYVLENRGIIDDTLNEFMLKIQKITREATKILVIYFIPDDVLVAKTDLENKANNLQNKWSDIRKWFLEKKVPYSTIYTQLIEIETDLSSCLKEADDYYEKLMNMYEVDVSLAEELNALHAELKDTIIALQKINISKVPEQLTNYSEEVKSALMTVISDFSMKPLDLEKMEKEIAVVTKKLSTLNRDVYLLMNNVLVFERTIQYGNRYRLLNQELAESLNMSEKLFVEAKYEEALKLSENAIEAIDSNFREKMMFSKVTANELNIVSESPFFSVLPEKETKLEVKEEIGEESENIQENTDEQNVKNISQQAFDDIPLFKQASVDGELPQNEEIEFTEEQVTPQKRKRKR